MCGLQERDKAAETDSALLDNMLLVLQAVEGECGQCCTGQKTDLLRLRVQHLENSHEAEIQGVAQLRCDVGVP